MFGSQIPLSGDSCTGTLASTLGALNPFRYRGYVYDEETQWYYLRSRYYDPTTGRFISADVLLSTGQGVLGHNAYAYCGDNSISRVDYNGACWEDFWEWLKSLFGGGNCGGKEVAPTVVVEVQIDVTNTPSPTPVPLENYYIDKMLETAEMYVGTPYGREEGQLDCSLFVQKVFGNIPDTGKRQKKFVSDPLNTYWRYQDLGPDDSLETIPRGAIIFYSFLERMEGEDDDHFYKVRHVSINAGNGMMYDSTNKPGINGVSKRSLYSELTYKKRIIVPTGYAEYLGWGQ